MRQGINAGAALVAHGEFTIILAQLAAGNAALTVAHQDDIVAFAGLYVLASADGRRRADEGVEAPRARPPPARLRDGA